MSVKNRLTIIFNWDVTAYGNKYTMKNVKMGFIPTSFRLKQLSVHSPAVIPNQGILILNSDLAENHIPYLGLIIDDELTNCDTEFNINKNKVNSSDVTFYIERLAENPLYGGGGVGVGGGIEQINILDPLDLEICFSIEFLEYEK